MKRDDSRGDESFGGLFPGADATPTWAAPSGISTGRRLAVPSLTELMVMSPDELEVLMERMLSSKRREDPGTTAAGDMHEDGTLRLPSMEAVWLLTKIGAQTGKPRFFDLRKIPVSRLRSLQGIAHVIHEALGVGAATA